MEILEAGVHTIAPHIQAHIFESHQPGPTAIIQAGIHGDEIAGVHALQGMLEGGIRPLKGRLIVIPVMNPGAFQSKTRAAPNGLDLNRCFPGDPESDALENRLAHRFMSLVMAEQPRLVATLHESKKRYDPLVNPSFGQTLVYGVKPMPPEVGLVVDRLNEEIRDPNEQWAPQYYPVDTSSTEVIVAAVGCLGVCVETWMGFDLARRVQMQQSVVRYLLASIGMA